MRNAVEEVVYNNQNGNSSDVFEEALDGEGEDDNGGDGCDLRCQSDLFVFSKINGHHSLSTTTKWGRILVGRITLLLLRSL